MIANYTDNNEHLSNKDFCGIHLSFLNRFHKLVSIHNQYSRLTLDQKDVTYLSQY